MNEKNSTDLKSNSSRSNSGKLKTEITVNSGLHSCATFCSGRPNLYPMLLDLAEQAEGEMGIAVCGPLGLGASVRMTVAMMSDDRAIHKGSGAQGICVHVESVWY
jgi:hypothetical protein